MSTKSQTFHWIALGVATVVVLAGAVAAQICSSAAVAPLTLTIGESVTLPTFRLFPDTVRLSLEFARQPDSKRPELGIYAATQGPDYLEFESPGEPVVIQVQTSEWTGEFEALPATSYGEKEVGRNLVPRELDNDPRRFRWSSDHSTNLKLSTGTSKITLKVLDVGASLSGETVNAIVAPPLSFKSSMPGYGFLWFFFFWPVLAVPLVIYAGVLLWQRWKTRA